MKSGFIILQSRINMYCSFACILFNNLHQLAIIHIGNIEYT